MEGRVGGGSWNESGGCHGAAAPPRCSGGTLAVHSHREGRGRVRDKSARRVAEGPGCGESSSSSSSSRHHARLWGAAAAGIMPGCGEQQQQQQQASCQAVGRAAAAAAAAAGIMQRCRTATRGRGWGGGSKGTAPPRPSLAPFVPVQTDGGIERVACDVAKGASQVLPVLPAEGLNHYNSSMHLAGKEEETDRVDRQPAREPLQAGRRGTERSSLQRACRRLALGQHAARNRASLATTIFCLVGAASAANPSPAQPGQARHSEAPQRSAAWLT